MCCHVAFHSVSIISVSFQDKNINGHEFPRSPLTTIHSSFSKIKIWQILSGTDWIKIWWRLRYHQSCWLPWILTTVYNFKTSITNTAHCHWNGWIFWRIFQMWKNSTERGTKALWYHCRFRGPLVDVHCKESFNCFRLLVSEWPLDCRKLLQKEMLMTPLIGTSSGHQLNGIILNQMGCALEEYIKIYSTRTCWTILHSPWMSPCIIPRTSANA